LECGACELVCRGPAVLVIRPEPGLLPSGGAADNSFRSFGAAVRRLPSLKMTASRSETLPRSDVELVRSAQHGDRGAFQDLTNRYAAKVYRLARHITKNDQDAEDVLQDAFLKAYSRLGQFQGESKFYTWLVRIAVNESLMRIRRRDRRPTVSLDQEIEGDDGAFTREMPSEAPTPEETFSREELRQILEEAIDSLAENYRTVFVLRDIDGLSTEESAKALNLTSSAVKSRLLRARTQLREKLRRRGVYAERAQDHV